MYRRNPPGAPRKPKKESTRIINDGIIGPLNFPPQPSAVLRQAPAAPRKPLASMSRIVNDSVARPLSVLEPGLDMDTSFDEMTALKASAVTVVKTQEINFHEISNYFPGIIITDKFIGHLHWMAALHNITLLGLLSEVSRNYSLRNEIIESYHQRQRHFF